MHENIMAPLFIFIELARNERQTNVYVLWVDRFLVKIDNMKCFQQRVIILIIIIEVPNT